MHREMAGSLQGASFTTAGDAHFRGLRAAFCCFSPAPAGPLVGCREERFVKVVSGPLWGMALPTVAKSQTPKAPEMKGQTGPGMLLVPSQSHADVSS